MNNDFNNNMNNNFNNQQPMNNQQINPAMQGFQQSVQQPMNNQQVNPAMQGFQQSMNQVNTNINVKGGMNKNAITSCIFSVVAIFIFGWLAYAGLGLGISAIAEIKKNKQKGMAFAIIGIIIGFVGTVLNIYGIMMR